VPMAQALLRITLLTGKAIQRVLGQESMAQPAGVQDQGAAIASALRPTAAPGAGYVDLHQPAHWGRERCGRAAGKIRNLLR
jgi:hypothetical protein